MDIDILDPEEKSIKHWHQVRLRYAHTKYKKIGMTLYNDDSILYYDYNDSQCSEVKVNNNNTPELYLNNNPLIT